MMKKVICILVAVLGLVCVAQASSSWSLYDDFSSGSLSSSRWWAPPTVGYFEPDFSGGKLVFESEYVGDDLSSYAVVSQSGVRGIRATLRVNNSSDSENGGVEIVGVNAASGYEYQCQFKLECWGDSLNLSAAVQENPDNVSRIEIVSANFSTDYDLSIVIGDDDHARFYLNGQLFATSSQLTKDITDFGVGSWNVEPGRVLAFADNVHISTSSADVPGVSDVISGTYESAGFPAADTGQWIFSADGTFESTFVEASTSISSGTYTYDSDTLWLHFLESDNPNLEGAVEVHYHVTVDGDLFFGDRDAVFVFTGSSEPVALLGMAVIPAGVNNIVNPYGVAYSLTNEVPFFMDATEVTKHQWDAVYNWAVSNGYGFDNPGLGKVTNHPVHSVSWYDCVKWCNARSEINGKVPCYTVSGNTYKSEQSSPDCNPNANGYRLPTEKEWEYAARGGRGDGFFPWGDTASHDQANFFGFIENDEIDSDGYHPDYDSGGSPFTSPVGSFEANGYNLYDVVGNVQEWCFDSLGSTRLLRGGSWWEVQGDMGGAVWGLAATTSDRYGFRSVCSKASAAGSSELTGISLSGPPEINENSSEQYTCAAHYSDGSTSNVTSDATLSLTSPYADVWSSGQVNTKEVTANQTVTLIANYQGEPASKQIQVQADTLLITNFSKFSLVQDQVTVTLSGRVVAGDGSGVSGISIGMEDPLKCQSIANACTTDSNGNFTYSSTGKNYGVAVGYRAFLSLDEAVVYTVPLDSPSYGYIELPGWELPIQTVELDWKLKFLYNYVEFASDPLEAFVEFNDDATELAMDIAEGVAREAKNDPVFIAGTITAVVSCGITATGVGAPVAGGVCAMSAPYVIGKFTANTGAEIINQSNMSDDEKLKWKTWIHSAEVVAAVVKPGVFEAADIAWSTYRFGRYLESGTDADGDSYLVCEVENDNGEMMVMRFVALPRPKAMPWLNLLLD